MHAAIDYVLKHDALSWWQTSNTIVVLEVADEAKILEMAAKLESEGIRHALFRERAMGMQATSIALDPEDERAQKLTKRLKLALSTLA
jgi:peptidyl-tRNA hydrolase